MRVLELRRHFEASPERIFTAFTDARQLADWYGPTGVRVPSCSTDVRPGGHYRIEMHSLHGDGLVVSGQFRGLHRPRWLSFTLARHTGCHCGVETLVTLEFSAQDGGTLVTLRHSGLSGAYDSSLHESVWRAGFARLDGTLAGRRRSTEPAPLLLGPPSSSHVHTACLAFAEKGVAYRHDPQLPRTPGCDTTHVWCRMPCLESGTTRLFETLAIVDFVDAAFAGPPLMPGDKFRRAMARRWISAINSYFYDAIIVRHVLPQVVARAAGSAPDANLISGAVPDIQRCLGAVDAAYGLAPWLAGEHMSAADLLLAPLVQRLLAVPGGADLVAPFVALRRAYGVLAERPAFAATSPDLSLLH
ncbi:MAG: SRPBCC domain-containing protein [Rhodocyclaceae bacterium]|nr:SRPBCC domain-containing protein [Rhodocyclaceae bacterium]MBX3670047.1 SRPBCC domain-containing protein [Rhodocyclaceae bacterium]